MPTPAGRRRPWREQAGGGQAVEPNIEAELERAALELEIDVAAALVGLRPISSVNAMCISLSTAARLVATGGCDGNEG